MGNYQHFITTTYNVPANNWQKTRDGQKALSNEWFKDRIVIFRKYCLPSFKNQYSKNFQWLVFFDVNTPDFYKTEIEKIRNEFPVFNPFFVANMDEKKVRLLQEVKNLINKDTEFIITTDIDNDDILHKDFVKTVQENFKPVHNLAIDLRRGLQLTKTSETEAFITDYYAAGNPFVSVVENVSKEIKTCAGYFHNDTRNFENIQVYDKKPMFMQFIHGFNMMNTTSDFKRFSNIDQDDFGIPREYQFKISGMKTGIYNAKRAIKLLKKRFLK